MADPLTPPGPDDGLPAQLQVMIVRVLLLEGVTPSDIRVDDPLFGEGLGLDSVDALELAIHIEESFGVKIPDDGTARSAFHSVSSLAAYIRRARTAGGA